MTGVKTGAVEVCWKCFSWASPSHNPQQLSSTARRNVPRGQLPLPTAAEVRGTRTAPHRTAPHRTADSHAGRGTFTKMAHEPMGFLQINKVKESKSPSPFFQHCPSPTHGWNLYKLGQPTCQSLHNIISFGKRAKSPSFATQFRHSYLVCVAQQAGAAQRCRVCLPLSPHELGVRELFLCFAFSKGGFLF